MNHELITPELQRHSATTSTMDLSVPASNGISYIRPKSQKYATEGEAIQRRGLHVSISVSITDIKRGQPCRESHARLNRIHHTRRTNGIAVKEIGRMKAFGYAEATA